MDNEGLMCTLNLKNRKQKWVIMKATKMTKSYFGKFPKIWLCVTTSLVFSIFKFDIINIKISHFENEIFKKIIKFQIL